MTINLTADQLTGLAYGTAKRNAANPTAAPLTDEEFAADLLGVQCDRFAAEKDDDEKSFLAQDTELLQLGIEVSSAPPEKRAAALTAAREALK